MIRFIAAILLLPWVVGFAVQLPALAKSIYAEPNPLAPFGVGVGLYALVWALFIRKRGRGVWDTFEHELTHAVFCVLLFKKVRSFHADSNPDHRGFLGYVAHEEASGFRGVLITLAPYFFPTFTAFLLLIRLLVAEIRFRQASSRLLGVRLPSAKAASICVAESPVGSPTVIGIQPHQ